MNIRLTQEVALDSENSLPTGTVLTVDGIVHGQYYLTSGDVQVPWHHAVEVVNTEVPPTENVPGGRDTLRQGFWVVGDPSGDTGPS